jgi:N-acyl-D-amino-acid deacylase
MRRSAIATALVLLAVAAPAPAQQPATTTLIVNARIVDGTGAPSRAGAVRIAGDRIMAVGALAAGPGERMIDARGLVLAPGFIDNHSHHDSGLAVSPDAVAAVSQGITTIVVGQDGGSAFPLSRTFAQLEATPAAVNVASYVGHNTLRSQVLGADFRRAATAAEVDSMRALLRAELASGALGLSTGLEYDPGIYAAFEEVLTLARETAAHRGRYISHMRSEDRHFWAALDELLEIGRRAAVPVQISHAKLAARSLWGQAPLLLARLDSARAAGTDVTLDVYPYTYWQSTLTVLFPERDFDDLAEAEFVLEHLAPADGLLLSAFGPEPSYVGRTVAEIAALRGTPPARTLLDLINEALAQRASVNVIGTSMDEADIETIMRWPLASISSDGALAGRHPRGFGAYPRVLGRYVRDGGVLTLEEAVRRMSAQAALNVGVSGRGFIAPGMFADLVLFDPDRVIDRATSAEPQEVSEGIVTVWVNGAVVWQDGAATGARPGRVVRR